MTRFTLSARIGFAALFLATCASAKAATITEWNFGTVAVTASANSPSPTTGSGALNSLGMTNNYTYSNNVTGSVTSDDILKETVPGTGGNNDVWRIRGTTPGNGWNLAAPQYSQGAEADVSTAGYSGIGLSFLWASTAQGILNLQTQYTLDGSTWTNIGSLITSTTAAYQTNTIDFSGISGANNDPLFGVRLVSAYNPVLATYASSTLSGGNPVVYNNSSGNWRFSDITISGTAVSAVPLPASAWLLLSGLVGLGAIARRRRGDSGSIALTAAAI